MAKKPKSKKPPQMFETFEWKGVNRRGEKITGELRAKDVNDARVQLRKQGIASLKLKKKPKPLISFGNSISAMDIAVVTRQIATMLTAGVPLVQAIEMIGKGHDKEKMRELMNELYGEVSAGSPLADTLRKHPQYFDDLYCDLVASGEMSGSLDSIYDRIALYKEKAEALKAKIKKALTYPTIVVLVCIVVTAILLLYVVPSFEEIFQNFGAELPAFTQLVIGLSNWLQAYFLAILGSLILGGWGFKQLHLRYKSVRDKSDTLLLKLPIVGLILNKAAVARYARTLSTTFAAGVPLIDALDSAAGASGNAVYRDAILSIKQEVAAGIQLNVAMRLTNQFPDMVNQMVAIGEEAGALDDMLAKVANIYEAEVDDLVDNLSAMLEPLIMVVLGTIVGGLIVSMYLPIFQMGQVVG